MKVNINSLPSKGLTIKNTNIKTIDIKPLTYKQLITYTSMKYSCDIADLIAQIDTFITCIPGWQFISAFDLSCILFSIKYFSATYDKSIKIPYENKLISVNLEDITFKDMKDDLLHLKTVELSGETYLFKIPTIEEFLDTLRLIYSKYNNYSWLKIRDCMILSALGINSMNVDEYLYMYENISSDDITTLVYLDDLLNDHMNDVVVKSKDEEGGESAININNLIADPFQLILCNRIFDQRKIRIK